MAIAMVIINRLAKIKITTLYIYLFIYCILSYSLVILRKCLALALSLHTRHISRDERTTSNSPKSEATGFCLYNFLKNAW